MNKHKYQLAMDLASDKDVVITQEDYDYEIMVIPGHYITCQKPTSNLHFKTEAEIIQEEWDKFLEDGPKDEKK